MSAPPKARVCVPVCVDRAAEVRGAFERAAPHADIFELRLDCLAPEELEAGAREAADAAGDRPLILTLRPREQGGRRDLTQAERLDFWKKSFPQAPHTFADIELDLARLLLRPGAAHGFAPDWGRVVCSHHDFSPQPSNLEAIYEGLAATPAAVLKLAVGAETAADCAPVFRLLERAGREGRQLIPVAMGDGGLLTRVLGPARGAFLTFGPLDEEGATAPGQITARELRDLYRVRALDRETKVCGLVGSPVTHSLSPHMHNAAFAARGVNAVYVPLETRDAGEFVRRLARPSTREVGWGMLGFSVTAPHKASVMRHLDRIEPRAAEVGAVNTVVVGAGGELGGHNTDAAAALAPVRGLTALGGARAAVIGSGGAARAVLWGLREEGAAAVVFARDPRRARETAEAFGASVAELEGARFAGFDLVVNATPLGTRGHSEAETPATAEQLRGAALAYDLVYNPSETLFMREARRAGCRAVGGLEMLVAQAAEQFRLWTGLDAPTDLMREKARLALEARS